MLKFAKSVPIAAAVTLSGLFMLSDTSAQNAVAQETQKASTAVTIDRVDADQSPGAKPATRQSTKKKKKTSPCQYLAKVDCEEKAQCGWIVPKKRVDTRGRNLQAYCRKTARTTKRD